MSAEVHQADQRTLVRREVAAAVTLPGDDEQGDPLEQGMRQVECGRIGKQLDFWVAELRRRAPPNGTGALSVADVGVVTRSVAMLTGLSDPGEDG